MSLPVSAVYNEGTDFEFSVSDTLENLISGGLLNENTLSEYCYTGFIDDMVNSLVVWEDIGSGDSNQYSREHCGVYWNNDNKKPNHVIINYALANKGDVVYMRNVLLYNSFNSGNVFNKTTSRIVTDIHDIKKWYMNFDKGDGISTVTLTSAATYSPANAFTGTAYSYRSSISYGATIVPDTEDPSGITYSLHPCNILIVNGEMYIGFLNPSNNYRATGSSSSFTGESKSWCQNNTYGHSDLNTWLKSNSSYVYTTSTNNYIGYPAVSANYEFPDFETSDGVKTSYLECDNGVIAKVDFRISDDYYTGTNADYEPTYAAKDKKTIRHWFSWCGIKFKSENVMYKPIIEGGIITGYTSDMEIPSEFDDMTNVTGNNIPVTPPSPGPSGDDEDNKDPVATAGAPYAKGLVNYYAMTAGSVLIDHISKALSTWDLQNTGKDLYKNLVSCKLIKPPAAIPTTGSEPFTIYGEKPQYEGADITLPVVSGNPDATFGPYSISRKFNDFRDYAPYTRVCIYLPYCGWCDLPSHVVGKSVTVKYFTDIIAATVRAVVLCNNNIIAEAAGVMGLDIPFTADAVGMKQAGVVSGLTAYAGGALQTAAGVASIVTTKGGKGIGETLSGASKLVSAYTQTAIAFNENTTEISGKNGDGCCLSGATNIIIKIIRPKYGASSTAPFVPAGFAHSIGFVSNKQVRVGSVSGLLIADNVDTSGIAGATDAERAEIKRVLESGLIVNAAPQ